MNQVIKPKVGHCHSILSQSSSFIRTDGRSRTQSFDGLQMFDETIFGRHLLGRQRERHGDGDQQTFRNVCHDYSDQKEDSLAPVVPENEGHDEEDDSDEDRESGDDVNEVADLLVQGRLVSF